MSKILAIDSSSPLCSVALISEGLSTQRLSTDERQHARQILPMIADLLNEKALRVSDLDAIAVVSGPGSFTGLRIGVGVAQGLAYGAGLPVTGISSLAVMAKKAMLSTGMVNFLVCLRAREGEIYSAAYRAVDDDVVLLGEERVSAPDAECFTDQDAGIQWTAIGDGWEYEAQLRACPHLQIERILRDNCFADAITLAVLAHKRFDRGLVAADGLVIPSYLKEHLDYK